MIQTYIMLRLSQWSAWYHSGSNPAPKRVHSWWGPMVLDRNVEHVGGHKEIPFNEQEAREMDCAVNALPDELYYVIDEAYLKGGTIDQKVRALRCCRQTYYNRLERSYVVLLGLLNDQAAGIVLARFDRGTKKELTRLDCFRTFTASVA